MLACIMDFSSKCRRDYRPAMRQTDKHRGQDSASQKEMSKLDRKLPRQQAYGWCVSSGVLKPVIRLGHMASPPQATSFQGASGCIFFYFGHGLLEEADPTNQSQGRARWPWPHYYCAFQGDVAVSLEKKRPVIRLNQRH